MASLLPDGVTTRPARADDEPFRFDLYASTRADEVAGTGWPAEQQQAFLRQQFTARRSYYRQAFPGADEQVLLRDGAPIGVVSLHRTAVEIRLVDLALLPAHRGTGLGTTLLRRLQVEAASTGLPLRLQVFSADRAVHLYRRLGFVVTAENGPYLKLEWRA